MPFFLNLFPLPSYKNRASAMQKTRNTQKSLSYILKLSLEIPPPNNTIVNPQYYLLAFLFSYCICTLRHGVYRMGSLHCCASSSIHLTVNVEHFFMLLVFYNVIIFSYYSLLCITIYLPFSVGHWSFQFLKWIMVLLLEVIALVIRWSW